MDQPVNPTISTTSQPVGANQAATTSQTLVPPKPKKKFTSIFIWIGITIALLLLIFAALKFFKKTPSSSSEITWWGLWEDSSIVDPLIAAYKIDHPSIKINYVKQSPRDYRERLTNSLAKGTGPDIFAFHNTWVPMFRNDLDFVPSSILNAADFAKTFYPIATSDMTSGNGLVGIPLEYDALTLFINQDIFDKSGKTPPTTWDDLVKVALDLTVKDDQGIITQSGIALGRTENVDHWQEILALLMLQNGVDLFNPIGKPAQDAISFFVSFSKSLSVWDVTLPNSTQDFAAGKLAMYIGPSWRAFEIIDQNPSLKFKTVPIPQLPKDNPKQLDVTYATYWSQGVSAKSTNKSAAWNFLKYLSSQDSMQKLFSNASKLRNFGEPYSRIDMASLLTTHPLIGSIINQAPGAKSWYLASRTFDGPTGINSQLSNYFADAVNSVLEGKETPEKALETATLGIKQILTQYRLVKAN